MRQTKALIGFGKGPRSSSDAAAADRDGRASTNAEAKSQGTRSRRGYSALPPICLSLANTA
jgi:hypothetical protein